MSIIPKLWIVTKVVFVTKKATMTRVRNMHENANRVLLLLCKWYGVLLKMKTSHSFEFRKEINENICIFSLCLKNVRNRFLVTFALVTGLVSKILILTFHLCPNLSDLGHKQGFDLVVKYFFLYCILYLLHCSEYFIL